MMFARSRSILTLSLSALVAAGFLSGCGAKKTPKPEVRLPRTAMTESQQGEDQWAEASPSRESDITPVSSDSWSPGDAPASEGFGDGTSVDSADSFMDDAEVPENTVVDETGSYANTASTDGVEDATTAAELEMIHFPFDSFEITGEFRPILNDHASWLQDNQSVMVQIEGHCDERGTEEYNLSLGQKRADAVREFLIEEGVDPNRLSTISYGEMRPLTFETDEEAHSLNRRAMFLVYEVDNTVASAESF